MAWDFAVAVDYKGSPNSWGTAGAQSTAADRYVLNL